ncbi:hypothetical protein PHMEG_00010224 [Phytophthora megakarya]|uniref:RxLR effector protein n=1 Tax=Phytophthora megakarya TaxID=4795 RepID=A0A225WEJ7_9STRA|nr:hypothetical protein PHMEG_00010224 [Phytophthora megakarya]
MRSLFWIYFWGLVCLSAYTEVTLAMDSEKLSELDSVKSTPVSFSENTQTVPRFLRRDKAAPTDTALGVNNAKEEERGVVVDKLKGVGVNLVESMYKSVGKLVGQAKVDKFRTNFYQEHVEKLFKNNVNPDIFLIKANRETNPILKAKFMRIDRMYKDLLEEFKKFRAKLHKFYLKLLYKMKTDPDELLVMAKDQPYPILRARHVITAERYKALLRNKQKTHHS